MSNLPKIFAHCKAGCLWETVHRSEFENAAYIVRQPTFDGEYNLEIEKGVGFWIKGGTDPITIKSTTSARFSGISDTDYGGTTQEKDWEITIADEFVDGIKVKVLGFRYTATYKSGTLKTQCDLYAVCEVNGERKEFLIISETLSGDYRDTDFEQYGFGDIHCVVTATVGNNTAYRLNEDATIHSEGYTLSDQDKSDIASLVLQEFTDVAEVGQ